jgi:hypothetical protein
MNTSPYWNTGSFNSSDPFGPLNQMNQMNQFSQPFNDVWGPLRDLSFQSQGVNGPNGSFPSVPSNLPTVAANVGYLDVAQAEAYMKTGQLPATTSTTTTTTPTPEMTAARALIMSNSGGAFEDTKLSQVARAFDANGDGSQELVFQYDTGGSALKFIPGSSPGTEKDFEELFAQAMASATKSASKTISGALSTLAIVGSGTDAATGKTYYIIKITNTPQTSTAATPAA